MDDSVLVVPEKRENINKLNEKYLEEFRKAEYQKAKLEDDKKKVKIATDLGLFSLNKNLRFSRIFASKELRKFYDVGILATSLLKPICKKAIDFGGFIKRKILERKIEKNAQCYLNVDKDVLGYAISEDKKEEIRKNVMNSVNHNEEMKRIVR